ncbi:LuxR C-terminal-related transcriptional regulator [Polluticaenibacter yanchengensis]|uniref:LuxR C-terminal-related transcriptional regulator n=1 Tax=Polluticaenibacter yanchengensis TaxID=3014562 RepID=A0ABT4UMH1_9BACT|nr:LuxR C-terminal-related transcriptional regulator [Chitinophagaceae bacterium LY-5]
MKEEFHPLKAIWDRYNNSLNVDLPSLQRQDLAKLLAEIFAVGEYYYYLLNLKDSTIHHFDDKILQIHGLPKLPGSVHEIFHLIHPDDINFVIEAEQRTIDKILEIGKEHILNLKSNYCFRMQTASGKYELFHHQAIHTRMSNNGEIVEAINIHTNIQHLTSKNNYSVLISGIGARNDFHFVQTSFKPQLPNATETLTKREKEVLTLIAKGLSSTEIANQLRLSNHTIIRHRKNIIKKTNAKNSAELIKKCSEWGYI